MSIREAFEGVNRNLQRHAQFGGNAQVITGLCMIKKIYPKTLTADIFIPKTSTTLFGIPVLFPYANRDSGMIIMPKENSPVLFLTTSDSRSFILASINTSYTDDVPSRVLENENLMYAEAGSFVKQDNLGNQILSSGSGSAIVLSEDNTIAQYSSSKTNKTLISKSVSGVTKIVTPEGLKTLEFQKFYGSITIPLTYDKAELESQGVDGLTADESIKAVILSSASSTIGMTQKLFTDIDTFKQDVMSNPYIDESQIKEKVSQIKLKLYNDYSLKKNTILTIEKGIAINKDVNSLDELSSLTTSDIETSVQNNNIVFRIKVLNEQTGDNIAILSVDSEGYILLKCKDFKTEVL